MAKLLHCFEQYSSAVFSMLTPGIGRQQQVLEIAPVQSVAAIKTWSSVCSSVILGP